MAWITASGGRGGSRCGRLDPYCRRVHPAGAPPLVYFHGHAVPRPSGRRQEGDRLGARPWPEVQRRPQGAVRGRKLGGHPPGRDGRPDPRMTRCSSPSEGADTSVTAAVGLYGYHGPSTATRDSRPHHGVRAAGCTAVPGGPRRQEHPRAHGARPTLRRRAGQRLDQSGGVRRAARGAARVRLVPLHPLRPSSTPSRRSPPGYGHERRRNRPSAASGNVCPLMILSRRWSRAWRLRQAR